MGFNNTAEVKYEGHSRSFLDAVIISLLISFYYKQVTHNTHICAKNHACDMPISELKEF